MHDLLIQVIFYVFAGLTVISALMVITQNNPVRCVLFLVLAFFASSILWILVQAEFLALILVLVYVGAVMTLFLFVVMMLNIDIESMKKHFIYYLPFGLILVALFVGLLLTAIPKGAFTTGVQPGNAMSTDNTTRERGADLSSTMDPRMAENNRHPLRQSLSSEREAIVAAPALSDTEALGMVLYTDYVFAFELAAVILLVAIVAAITLVHRKPIRSKRQSIVRQIMTRRGDRVKLVKMKSGD